MPKPEIQKRTVPGPGRYTLRDEWNYVNGVAKSAEKCTPGTRDEHNDGTVNSLKALDVFDQFEREAELPQGGIATTTGDAGAADINLG